MSVSFKPNKPNKPDKPNDRKCLIDISVRFSQKIQHSHALLAMTEKARKILDKVGTFAAVLQIHQKPLIV